MGADPGPVGHGLTTLCTLVADLTAARVRVRGYDPAVTAADPVLDELSRQLRAYFAGELETFDLPLAPAGTTFQLSVWRRLCEIPYGETISYGELARRLADLSYEIDVRLVEPAGLGVEGYTVDDDATRPGKVLTVTMKYSPERERVILGEPRDIVRDGVATLASALEPLGRTRVTGNVRIARGVMSSDDLRLVVRGFMQRRSTRVFAGLTALGTAAAAQPGGRRRRRECRAAAWSEIR